MEISRRAVISSIPVSFFGCTSSVIETSEEFDHSYSESNYDLQVNHIGQGVFRGQLIENQIFDIDVIETDTKTSSGLSGFTKNYFNALADSDTPLGVRARLVVFLPFLPLIGFTETVNRSKDTIHTEVVDRRRISSAKKSVIDVPSIGQSINIGIVSEHVNEYMVATTNRNGEFKFDLSSYISSRGISTPQDIRLVFGNSLTLTSFKYLLSEMEVEKIIAGLRYSRSRVRDASAVIGAIRLASRVLDAKTLDDMRRLYIRYGPTPAFARIFARSIIPSFLIGMLAVEAIIIFARWILED